jgi:hypothetical protein
MPRAVRIISWSWGDAVQTLPAALPAVSVTATVVICAPRLTTTSP